MTDRNDIVLEMLDKPPADFKPTLNIQEIMEFIPHRYPFLLVDRVVEHEYSKYIKGYKNVSMNEPFFQGHFPNNPIMPGVLIVEALAQVGCILVSHMPEGRDKLALFAGIDNVRFRRQVTPGDKLELYAELLKIKGPLGKALGKAYVDGELACEGELLFSLVPKSNDK